MEEFRFIQVAESIYGSILKLITCECYDEKEFLQILMSSKSNIDAITSSKAEPSKLLIRSIKINANAIEVCNVLFANINQVIESNDNFDLKINNIKVIFKAAKPALEALLTTNLLNE